MIINNTTNQTVNWTVSNSGNEVSGIKSPESWGTITPPAGPFDYSITMNGLSVYHIKNPDVCATYTGADLLITYPGA